MLRRQLGHIVEKAVQTQNLAFHAAYADKIERIFSQIRRHFAALEQRGYVIGYQFVKLGKMMEDIRHGKTPNEAYEKNVGTYGRFSKEQGAVKYIDPREE